MPWMQAVLERANTQFNSQHIGQQDPGQFSMDQDFVDQIQAMGIVEGQHEASHVRNWPESVLLAMQAAVMNAVARSQGLPAEETVPVQFTWTPAAGFGVSVWEAGGVGGSRTAITIQLQSPMPEPPQSTDPVT